MIDGHLSVGDPVMPKLLGSLQRCHTDPEWRCTDASIQYSVLNSSRPK